MPTITCPCTLSSRLPTMLLATTPSRVPGDPRPAFDAGVARW